MSQFLEPYPAFDVADHTLLGKDRKPVTLRLLLHGTRGDLRRNIFAFRLTGFQIVLRICFRLVSGLVGLSGLICAAIVYAVIKLERTDIFRYFGIWIAIGAACFVVTLLIRAAWRESRDGTFWISAGADDACRHLVEALGENQERLRNAVVALKARGGLPYLVRKDVERLLQWITIHQQNVARYDLEVAKARLYVERGHCTIVEALASLAHPREQLDRQRVEITEAISAADRLTIAAAYNGEEPAFVGPDLIHLREQLRKILEAGEAHSHFNLSVKDPRYASGRPEA